MDLHNVGIYKRLEIMVLVLLVVRQAFSEYLLSCLGKALSLSGCLPMVCCAEVVFGTQYFVYGVEELGEELLPDVG